ncbi:MAG: hypothetical protein H6739_08365 [Alphaproteobacteria bacterium]|nr:hypothetical protein [Alphaproteobacteria bacterium]
MHEDTVDLSPSVPAPPVFEHAIRPGWGLAVRIDEARTTRTYRFTDGEDRTFKQGWYHLLQKVDKPPAERKAIARDLGVTQTPNKSSLGERRKPRRARKTKRVKVKDQVRVFRHLHPEGFQGPTFSQEVRGDADSRPLKRLRAHAIATAQTRLAKDKLDRLIAQGRFEEVHAEACAVVGLTNLCSPSKDLKPLKALEPTLHEPLAVALRAMLWGEGDYGERFTAFVEVLRRSEHTRDTWPLTTVFSALVHPREHVCVQPRSFRKQKKTLAPRLTYSSNPTPEVYEGLRGAAVKLQKKLVERHALQPRDLMDVCAFIRATLCPKGLRILKELDAES